MSAPWYLTNYFAFSLFYSLNIQTLATIIHRNIGKFALFQTICRLWNFVFQIEFEIRALQSKEWPEIPNILEWEIGQIVFRNSEMITFFKLQLCCQFLDRENKNNIAAFPSLFWIWQCQNGFDWTNHFSSVTKSLNPPQSSHGLAESEVLRPLGYYGDTNSRCGKKKGQAAQRNLTERRPPVNCFSVSELPGALELSSGATGIPPHRSGLGTYWSIAPEWGRAVAELGCATLE